MPLEPIVLDQLRRLEPTDAFFDTIRALGDEVVPVGPFRAILDPRTDEIWASQAVPVEPLGSAAEAAEHVGALRRLFAARGRTTSVEFNEPLWPELPALLEGAGLVEYEREPLMLCTREGFRPYANPEATVRFLQPHDPDADLSAFQAIFFEVLVEKPWEETPERLDRFRAEVERVGGRGHALATLDGRPVGTGFISSSNHVGEIARVGTVPAARRRGVAATLTSFMMRDRFEHGDTLIWLSAADAPAQALYEKLGFRAAGDRVYFRERP
ncbi:MAG: GNAT family N-acetyltransferase [Chloroflexi bacterium]|nr:GNAT family N-acetyltransferase [Chloroflexota bacterium]